MRLPALALLVSLAASAQDLAGVIDIHCHSDPDAMPRSIDGIALAKLARERGMRGLVLKNHYESTAGLAWLARQQTPGLEVFGGIALNRAVGGINPAAVEHMTRVRGGFGRVVWMPTFDAENQVRTDGQPRPFVSVSKGGRLLPEVLEVLDLIARHKLVLATGHSSPEEVFLLIRAARERGIEHVVVTHAAASPVSMTAGQMRDAARLGAFIELTYNVVLEKASTLEQCASMIKEVGPESVIVSSDLGQAKNPLHPDGLAAFLQGLRRNGFTQPVIDRMTKTNPAGLLSLSQPAKPELAVRIPAPGPIAFNPQGELFAASGGKIWQVFGRDARKEFVTADATAMTFDVNGDLWLADRGAIRKVTPWGESSAEKGPRTFPPVMDEQGNRYLARGGVTVVNPAGAVIATYEVPGGHVAGMAFGGLDLKTLYVAEASTNAVYKLRVPHRAARLPWEPDAPLRITEPVNGAILNRHDGAPRIIVRGLCNRPGAVRVNGLAATVRDGRFEAPLALTARETKITAEGPGGLRDSVTVVWDRDSFPRYRVSTDDNIWFLRDIARNAGKYESIFENPYLSFWREMHRKYGAKVHFNIYYETEGFNLSDMPAKFRPEWQRNADWIRLTFHARANDPDRPYVHASAEQIRRDYRLVTREIERFAGKELLSPVTTVHWGTTTRAAARALREEGVRVLVGYFEAREELPAVTYYLPLAQWVYLSGRDYWKDIKEDLTFVRHDMVINSFPIEKIVPRLEQIAADPHQAEVMELMIHEQYFYPHYVAYEPDYRERVERAIEWVTRRGYKPVWYGEGTARRARRLANPEVRATDVTGAARTTP